MDAIRRGGRTVLLMEIRREPVRLLSHLKIASGSHAYRVYDNTSRPLLPLMAILLEPDLT